MSSLVRLLCLRSLLEDVSRGRLQAEANRAQSIEAALLSSEAAMDVSRQAGFHALAKGETRSWLLAEASAEIARWQTKQLAPALGRQQEKLEAAKQEYSERRCERRQVETVLAVARQSCEAEQERREQQQMDEWYASRKIAARQQERRHLR